MSENPVLRDLQMIEYSRAYLATADPRTLEHVAEDIAEALDLLAAAAEHVEERTEEKRAEIQAVKATFLAPPAA